MAIHRAHFSIGVQFVAMTLCAGLFVIVNLTFAEVIEDNITIHRSAVTGLASLISAQDGSFISLPPQNGPIEPLAALRLLGPYFGIVDPSEQLQLDKIETDQLGYSHSTYKQFHHGISVFSGVVRVHQDVDRRITAVNGDFYPISEKVITIPAISIETAVEIALAEVSAGRPRVSSSELVIVDPGWYGDSSTGPRLAYYVVVADPDIPLREACFVDADRGELLDRWSLIHTAKYREIYTGNGGSGLPGTLARVEGQLPTGDFDIDAAYDYFGDTYDYFFRGHGRDSIDGAGLTISATVHSTAPGCPNAYWDGSRMVFCDTLVTDDIVGHELTHGVTQYTAGLIYQNQSGQLNESMSDVFGELIDLFNGDAAFAGTPGGTPWPTHPTGPGLDTPNTLRTGSCSYAPSYVDGVRWLLGEDADAFGGPIRDMWNPPCFSDPDYANSSLLTCEGDNGGVHSGSGIPNHAFAILTDGKIFNGYTVTGIGPIKAGAVWYRALTVYMTPATDFVDAYYALNQAAAELVGTFPDDPRTGLPSDSEFTAFDAAQVDLALLAVEMNTDGACGAGDNILDDTSVDLCPSRTTVFADDFENGPNGWTVSNSAPLTPYDWFQTSDDLPLGHPGTVWFADDPYLGDCGANDESGTHSLFSPVIILPVGDGVGTVSFDHYLATEGGWDGGNVKISVNGGSWIPILRSAYTFNPYNGRIFTSSQGNTDPMAGESGFTGAGGGWGTSIIDLSGFAGGGDSIQLRFDLGKDGCTGALGWYVDNFEVYLCPDCDSDGVSDEHELTYTIALDEKGPITTGSPQSFTIIQPPPAGGDVILTANAYTDLASSTEWLDVTLNGQFLGSLFLTGAGDCPGTPDVESLVIPASTFNSLVAGGDATITLTATPDVGACTDPFVSLRVRYATQTPDGDGDGLPDSCRLAPCDGDANGDGTVDPLDSGFVLARLGCPVGTGDAACDASDQNVDGVVDPLDVGYVLARLGDCE